MKCDMEMDEIEAVIEKIWDLHDKLSDAILSISRAQFLNSIKFLSKKSERQQQIYDDGDNINRLGFVYVKDFPTDDTESELQEAKSLNAIRTALENLEDQLEFFHTVQVQQRAERDAAIARLEQSRIVLELKLVEHNGKNYKVIEEALAFVGNVRDAGCFVMLDNLYSAPVNPADKILTKEGKKSNILIKALISSLNFVRKTLNVDDMAGILGNVSLVAIGMVTFLHLHRAAYKEQPQKQESGYNNRIIRKVPRPSSVSLSHLDVMMGRG